MGIHIDFATDKQQKIIEYIPALVSNGGSSAIVRARPGTGKTTTLVNIVKTYPHLNFLYLSFSKTNVLKAKEIMPHNCKCSTVNSMALGNIPKTTSLKENEMQIVNKYSTRNISKTLKKSMKISAKVKVLFENFLNSDFSNLDNFIKSLPYRVSPGVKDGAIELIVRMMKREIPVTHNYCLKEFALRTEKGKEFKSIDCVLIDEYQDSSKVIASIYRNIKNSKLFVGDSDQAIFGFMGTVDASMGMVFDREFDLDENFRSLPHIIDKANDILTNFLGRNYQILSTKTEPGKSKHTNAIICRTVSAMIEYINIYDRFDLTKTPEEIFGLPIAIAEWKKGILMAPQFRFLKQIKTDKDLIKNIRESGDRKLGAAYKISNKYSLIHLQHLKAKAEKFHNSGNRNMIMTGHSAKGLEFSKVRVSPDFPNLKSIAKKVRAGKYDLSFLEEEIRLYFVALSRAKEILIDCSMNASLSDEDKFFIRTTILKYSKPEKNSIIK